MAFKWISFNFKLVQTQDGNWHWREYELESFVFVLMS